jgi:hypothetical protein
MNKGKVAVVIPIYQKNLSAYEEIALQQCQQVLFDYPQIVIKPKSLDVGFLKSKYHINDTVSFDDAYFKDVQGYNRLMLAKRFYQSFQDYEYILIYQLDAFVLRDELLYWCSQDIDYVGAPWLRIHGYPDWFKAAKSRIQRLYHARLDVYKNGLPSDMQLINKVGNGGFSLRRVKKLAELCIKLEPEINNYIARNEHYFNEDVFWSIAVNRKRTQMNIPGFKKGLKFAFEHAPQKALKLNNDKLPFGCHAWDKNIEFWRPVFKGLGHNI